MLADRFGRTWTVDPAPVGAFNKTYAGGRLVSYCTTKPAVATPAAPSVTAVYMRCCSAWEEYDESVNWSSYDEIGYVHWSRDECRL